MSIEVKVGTVPGVLKTIALDDDATAQDAITTAGVDASGYDVRVNGDSVALSKELEDGDSVLLFKQIKGNRK